MLRRLRARLIASHMALLLIVIPLVGLALIYVLESQVVLPNFARQLTAQGVLIAEMLKAEPAVWQDQGQAAAFVERINPLFSAQLTLLTPDGAILATSDTDDTGEISQRVALPGLAEAAAGRPYSRVRYSQNARAEVADILIPVSGAAGQVEGIVRLHDHLAAATERFWQLRVLTAAVLAVGLIVGALIGLFLAITIERPLARLTRAVNAFSEHREPPPLLTRGSQETRTLAAAFHNLAGRLLEQETARRHLLANVTHELGRPLAALRAAGRALLDGAADDVTLRGELLTGMDGEIGRMERLLDQLAALHDRAGSPAELAPQPVDLAGWLPALLRPWAAAANAAGLHWEVSLADDLPRMNIDPDRLASALGNLLSNAIKFTPAGGTVSVSSGLDEAGWFFRVTDTGPGIPLEAQERIFEPFYRFPPDRRYPQGLGAGLTIARDIVLAHGGTLTVSSTPGAGATFTVRLSA